MSTVLKSMFSTFWKLSGSKKVIWLFGVTTLSLIAMVILDINSYRFSARLYVYYTNKTAQDTPRKVSIVYQHPRNLTVTRMSPQPHQKKAFLCGNSVGRLGNVMFMYASVFGVALSKNMTPSFCDYDHKIFTIFKHPRAVPNYNHCRGNTGWGNKQHAAYNPEDVAFANDKNISMFGYFQSWFYFRDSFREIRQEFQFSDKIHNEAIIAIHDAVSNLTLDYNTVVYITVHVRRTDVATEYLKKFGRKSPGVKYYEKAMRWYRSRHNNTVFIVCSDDIKWARENLVSPDVVFIEGHSDGVDMAILSLGNHTIMSVGTFGWWGSFLAGGHTVAYATAAIEGTLFRQQFSADFSDYFLPHWTILDDD